MSNVLSPPRFHFDIQEWETRFGGIAFGHEPTPVRHLLGRLVTADLIDAQRTVEQCNADEEKFFGLAAEDREDY